MHELVVFDPEKVYILGSKQDIEGFKEFVSNSNNTSLEQTQPVETNNIVNITVDELASKIIDFKNSLQKKTTKIASNVITPVLAYKKLKESFSQEEKQKRVKMIATIFSDIVDSLEEEYPQLSRMDLLKGVQTSDGMVGGVKQIIDAIHNMLNEELIEAKIENNIEKADKIQKVFDNWGPLLIFAESEINLNEDVKLGMDLSFVDESNSNNREEDDQSFKFTMDASRREQWMEESDTRSAYGSIPKQVRKILGRIPEYENGKPKLDDLGFPIMQNRIKVHQTLMNMLRNRRSESHMMEILNNNLIEMSWLQPIIEELESSEEVKTQFYVALKRGFQLYSAVWSKIQDGVYKFTTPILNKVKGETSYKKFLTNLKLGEINNKKLSIYQKGAGNKNYIVSDKLVALKNLILKILILNLQYYLILLINMIKVNKKNFYRMFLIV